MIDDTEKVDRGELLPSLMYFILSGKRNWGNVYNSNVVNFVQCADIIFRYSDISEYR